MYINHIETIDWFNHHQSHVPQTVWVAPGRYCIPPRVVTPRSLMGGAPSLEDGKFEEAKSEFSKGILMGVASP